MADLVVGAMGRLIPKLGQLLNEEYNLHTGVKDRVRSLALELDDAHAALHKVAQVPWDELDEQVKLWAREVRESSYDMEDVLDTFLVRVQGGCDSARRKQGWIKRLGEKMNNLFEKSKARREISVGVKDIMAHLNEVTERCRRYKVHDIVAKPATASTVDPRLAAMYNKVKNLVGIDKSSRELISMLQTQHRRGDDVPHARMKVVSIVGVGGLGKTTLAKAVFDKLKGDFGCTAFVPAGRKPDLKKVFRDILIDFDTQRSQEYSTTLLDERQLINRLRTFLHGINKRYFVVIDDIWEIQSWDIIKLAFDDDANFGGRIIVTTRKLECATKAGEVYKLQSLSADSSRELFYARIFGDQGSHVDNQLNAISSKILRKCGGIPLAIITMASLLVGKPRNKWSELYRSIGFGSKDDSNDSESTAMRILSFSYYDLPSHLRTCLLYLGAFPEDSFIPKVSLIWRWIAEGFVHEEKGTWLFETGERYFNDLINKSLIQAVEGDYFYDGIVTGCHVHDMVLDFIRSMLREENFFTILNSHQDTSLQRHVRRLAHHNRTMGWRSRHGANHHDDMRTVRSFSVHCCGIESLVPLSSFRHLRVLAIENCNRSDGCCIRIEHVGHLLHLRYLSLCGTRIRRVPEEIGGLRFLQTLDLLDSGIVETPSSSSLPTQLVCLRITFEAGADVVDAEVVRVERLTSLQVLSIDWRFQWKDLSSLGELRVVDAAILADDVESGGEIVDKLQHLEKLQHLDKLQHLEILCFNGSTTSKADGLVLPRNLQRLAAYNVRFLELPQCINPLRLQSLSHLDLWLEDVDEKGLKTLGGMPELRFLKLELMGSAAVSYVLSDSGVVYFPKLRCCKLPTSMVVLFLANNKNDETVSFHLWYSDISHSDDGRLQRCMPSSADFDDENKEDSIFGKATAASRFMPSLQALHFNVCGVAAWDHGFQDNNLGLQYLLPSLREIYIRVPSDGSAAKVVKKLRRAADEHPNRPALRTMKCSSSSSSHRPAALHLHA